MTIQDQTASLRRVYVRPPVASDLDAWRSYGWHTAPDPGRAAAEHAAFREELARVGAEVATGTAPTPGDPDAIYAYDPTLLTDGGAILLRSGKPARRTEAEAMGSDLAALGVPIAGRVEAPGTADGGDLFWLGPSTLAAGVGYRTNEVGIAQLRELLGPSIDVLAVDLPHFHGPDECLHLMSFVSPLASDLAVAFLPMMPVRLLAWMRARDVRIVEVPEEEFATMGPNVLALAPRVALALEGNDGTRRQMEAAGVDVRTYAGDEISRKGDGGPTCLSRPLDRG